MRVCLPVQGTGVLSWSRKIPRATRQLSLCWATGEACTPQLEHTCCDEEPTQQQQQNGTSQGTVWCPGSPQGCLASVCGEAELGYGGRQTASRLKQTDSPWPAPFQVSPLSQQPCTSREVLFTPFTGRLSNLPRVTQPEGAELRLEPSLYGLKT